MAEEFQEIQVNAEMTAGEMLRVARTTGRRKREIPTISKQLCIREEFLEALESGDYAVLPEAVYILGFARNYAMELGLDPDVIVEKIKKEMGIVSGDAPVSHPVVPEKTEESKSAIKEKLSKKIGIIKNGGFGKFMMAYWKWMVGGIVLLIVITIILSMIFAPGIDQAAPSVSVETPQVVVVVNPEPVYNKDVRERFGTENRDKAEIIFQAIQESWVKVEDARGKTVFSRVLVPGDVYYVPAGKNKATFGNAGAIDVWVEGKLAPKVGAANTRKTGVALDKDSLMGNKKTDK